MNLTIKDLAIAKELSRDEASAVRGGSNVALVFGATQLGGSGFGIGSPVTQVAPQSVSQTDTTVSLASVLGSMNTLIDQTKVA